MTSLLYACNAKILLLKGANVVVSKEFIECTTYYLQLVIKMPTYHVFLGLQFYIRIMPFFIQLLLCVL